MSIPLPNLDDRHWADLVEEGRALIPVYAPEWTDHNAHDPGVTLMELFAWITEQGVFRVNRIPDRHQRKFLSLVGIEPRFPTSASTFLHVRLKNPEYPAVPQLLSLPAMTEFEGGTKAGEPIAFRALEPLTVLPVELRAVQVESATGIEDFSEHYLTDHGAKRQRPPGFGRQPKPGSALYLGLDILDSAAFEEPLQLYFRFGNKRSDYRERQRLLEEISSRRRLCEELQRNPCAENETPSEEASGEVPALPPHHSGRMLWEYAGERNGEIAWRALPAQDDTRSMTLDGRVRVWLPRDAAKRRVGPVEQGFHYIRCRLQSGSFDAPPVVSEILLNALAAEQSRPATGTWPIVVGAPITGAAPVPGETVKFHWKLSSTGRITELHFETTPQAQETGFKLLAYRAPTPVKAGRLTIDAALLGVSTGDPNQEFDLPQLPAVASSLKVLSLDDGAWRDWQRRADLGPSSAADRHFRLDAGAAVIAFGDGEHGLVPRRESYLFASFTSTRAEAGNLHAGTDFHLTDSPWNRLLLGDVGAVQAGIQSVRNGTPASGGDAEESLRHAVGRAIETRENSGRAVTLEDYQDLALETPGTQIARAIAKAGVHPGFDCSKAPGIVMLVIVPDMPGRRPTPSLGLRNAVQNYLNSRRILGTRILVIGPEYVEVTVRAKVQGHPGASKSRLSTRVADALNEFFDALRGGPERGGWPLGRDVYLSEVMDEIHRVSGTDHVAGLELIAGSCEPQCGNICLRPNQLVAAGRHEIEVL